jgi:O-methyltransferase domain
MKEAGHRCPTDPANGLIQYAFQTKLQIFDLLDSMPQVLKAFNTFMGNTMGARKYWVDWFPVEESILQGLVKSTTLIVDVGGGKGHDLQAFHQKYPHRGRLVLQDLPQTIDNIKDLDPAIESETYDFFTDQQIRGMESAFLSICCSNVFRCPSIFFPPHSP